MYLSDFTCSNGNVQAQWWTKPKTTGATKMSTSPIIVAYDGSPNADDAVALGNLLAHLTGAPLALAHVYRTPSQSPREGAGARGATPQARPPPGRGGAPPGGGVGGPCCPPPRVDPKPHGDGIPPGRP